jgi:hypothetical protein
VVGFWLLVQGELVFSDELVFPAELCEVGMVAMGCFGLLLGKS